MKSISGFVALGIATFLCLTVPALAQDRKAEINALIDKAIAEHTIFLNCTATERDSYQLISRNWQTDVLAAVPALADAGFTGDEIAAFTQRTSLDAILMKDRPFSEVIEFCRTSGQWMRQMYELRYVILPLAIKRVIDGAPGG